MNLSPTLILACAVALLGAACSVGANPLERTRKAACSAYKYKEQCEDESSNSDNCVWADTQPGDFDESNFACIAKSCETVGMGTFGDPKSECKNFPGVACVWHEQVGFCTSPGKDVPCEVYYADPDEGEECPSQCSWNKDAMKCVTKGTKLKCDNYYDENACSTEGCSWHAEIYKCWERGEDVPCVEYKYYDQEECPTYCKYITTGSDSFGNEEGACLEKDALISCTAFSSEEDDGASCPSEHCKWYESPLSVCWSKIKDLPCERLPGQMCAPEARCKWINGETVDGIQEDGSCSNCPAGQSCVSTYVGPPLDPSSGGKDTGLKCNQYAGATAMQCPEPRCFLEFSSSNAGGSCAGGDQGTCRDPQCSDLVYEEDQCTKLGSCTYEESSGVCYPTGGTFPCNDVYAQAECNAKASTCDWKVVGTGDDAETFCVQKGEDVPCSSYFEGSCPSNKCKFNTKEYECQEKDYVAPCIEYEEEGECPTAHGCAWTDGVCWEQGKELPCTAICTSFQCDSTGSCRWDQENYQCSKCEGGQCPELKDCSTYTSEETCPESKCEFSFDENSESSENEEGTCVDKVCADINEQAECAGKKDSGHTCAWNADSEECTLTGYTRACDKNYDVEQCTGTCTWDAANYRCNEGDFLTPCHSFMEITDCPKDRCQVNGDTCTLLQTLLPATPPPLTGKGDGTGNEDWNQCTSTMYDGIKGKLEAAETECVVAGRRGRRSNDEQLECLAYFLGQAPNKATVADACPCLWFFAREISPQEDHWMQIAC